MDRRELDEGEVLLRQALSQPGRAIARATVLLGSSQGSEPGIASAARQARGIVLRDRGETAAAIRELRGALALALESGRAERVADVRASLGAALVMAGRTEQGLAQLDLASSGVPAAARAKVLMRRAFVLAFLGRHEEALADLRIALVGVRRAGDAVWEARTLNLRAQVLLAVGEIGRAERDVRRAEQMFASAGQRLEAVHALHNRGRLAHLRGDLPRAFALYDRAAIAYAELGTRSADLIVDRCEAFLAAGLTGDAVDLATRSLASEPLQARHRADVLLVAATAALAHGDAESAVTTAQRARRAFTGQGRPFWVTRCELVAAQARFLAGLPVRLSVVRRVAAELLAARADEAALALLLAGRVAAERGADGHSDLMSAARFRTSHSPQVRAAAWLALALDHDEAGDRRGVLRAARQGLAALAEHRSALGSTHLRALATRHGAELSALALRHALASGDARALVSWSERSRAVALSHPAVRPPQDPALAAELAAMRAVARAIDEGRERGTPIGGLAARLAGLEAAIDRRQRRAVGQPSGGVVSVSDPDLRRLLESLDGRTLVELVDVEGVLHAVVVRGGRFRRLEVGSASMALGSAKRARFALRQAARGRAADLPSAATQLQDAVFGPAAGALGDEPVVVVPPASLHHVPWGLCPALAELAVSAAPSAARWLAAVSVMSDAAGPGATEASVLVAGPGLHGADAEVGRLAAARPGARVLRGPDSTVATTLQALDGAAVVHIAAHGRHRPDNPMFSSLQLVDGPLTVHDLETLREPPRRIVLSACDSGVMAAVGADALLGLAMALLDQGSAGVVCAVSEVNDEATAPVMVQVHDALNRGLRPDQALLEARGRAGTDPLAVATAASFVCLGA